MQNKKNHLAQSIILCGLLLGALPLAHAAEVIFNVPLSITNYPSSKKLSLICEPTLSDGSNSNGKAGLPIVYSLDYLLVNGSYKGTFTKVLSVSENARGWHCNLASLGSNNSLSAEGLNQAKDLSKPQVWDLSGKF